MKFKDGTLVKGAYVIIDGVEYEVHMPEYSGNTPVTAENLNKMQEDIFPVGSTYITQTNTNPNSILGFGTWERLKGKVVVGLDEEDPDFNEIGNEIGEKTHTLTVNEMPTHAHNVYYNENSFGAGSYSNNAVRGVGDPDASGSKWTTDVGGGQAHNNIQPTKVVGYMWIRTA